MTNILEDLVLYTIAASLGGPQSAGTVLQGFGPGLDCDKL
jgi:hypothetical protein